MINVEKAVKGMLGELMMQIATLQATVESQAMRIKELEAPSGAPAPLKTKEKS